MTTYQALEVTQQEANVFATVTDRQLAEPKENEVIVKIHYSSLNYKDALATKQNGGVIRNYPMVPGIDLAGEILASHDPQWPIGEKVLVTGFGLGVTHPGGYSQAQVVPTDWLVRLPDRLSLKESMLFGTAGFTAALAVLAVIDDSVKKNASIFVTGATGGVASIAIGLLASLGYQSITAITRKKETAQWLTVCGATSICTPEEVLPEKKRPLAKQTIDVLIDTVGGPFVSELLPSLSYGGKAALCGNAGGIQLETTVLPFILRSVQLIGIDSVAVPIEKRAAIWDFLAAHKELLTAIPQTEIALSAIPAQADLLLAGTHSGRTLISIEVKK
ncbi:MAG TPA: NADPH:quinone reductase [Enterococcus sp.]|nr:NADPH:quinone reductase [Enterococcus sp.]